MEELHRPIDTGLDGDLQGRDAISLGSVCFTETLRLEMEGCFYPEVRRGVHSEAGVERRTSADGTTPPDTPFTLVFFGLLAYRMVELDTWESMLTSEDNTASSFDEVLNSEWLARMGGKARPTHKHYQLITYDFVLDIICDSFELTTGKSTET